MISPCQNCRTRDKDCHVMCGKYREWRKAKAEDDEKRRAFMDRINAGCRQKNLTKKAQDEWNRKRVGK